MRIGIIGARGVNLPGRSFGGFEAFISGLAPQLAQRGHDVTVYCRRQLYQAQPAQHQGVRLRWLPAIEGKALGTPTHTLLAMADAVRERYDALFVVNPGNGFQCLLPRLLTRTRIVMNVDGVEWERGKWGPLARAVFRVGAWISTKVCHGIVADSLAIADLYRRDFGVQATFVPYAFDPRPPVDPARVRALGLEPGGYYLAVGRLIPENNVDYVVEEFIAGSSPRCLVVVGGANYSSPWHERLQCLASDRVRFMGHVDDFDLLWDLYGHAYGYIHGHSVGGTNPALLQAMATATCPVVYDVIYNREVAGQAGIPFTRSPGALRSVIDLLDRDPAEVARRGRLGLERLRAEYSWQRVVTGYEAVLQPGLAPAVAAPVGSGAQQRP